MRFMAMVMVLAMTWCCFGAVAPEVAPTYRDRVYGFSMVSPNFGETKSERVDVVVFQDVPVDGFAANVIVTVDPVKTTRDEYIQNSMAALQANNPKVAVRSVLPTDTNKDRGTVEYEANMAGRRLHFLQLVVVTENRVFIVTCTAPAETYANYKEKFEATVGSFKVAG